MQSLPQATDWTSCGCSTSSNDSLQTSDYWVILNEFAANKSFVNQNKRWQCHLDCDLGILCLLCPPLLIPATGGGAPPLLLPSPTLTCPPSPPFTWSSPIPRPSPSPTGPPLILSTAGWHSEPTISVFAFLIIHFTLAKTDHMIACKRILLNHSYIKMGKWK